VGAWRKPSVDKLTLTAAHWRKASASNNEGACVRVAHHDAYVLLDDSKHPSPATGEALVLAPNEWRAFRNALAG
jgi:hypothetical protein